MTDLVADAASAQDIGARSRQEDSVVAHATDGADPVLAVLSDGMGGHEDGDLASRIIASEVFGELFVASSRRAVLHRQTPQVFKAALNCANLRLKQHIDAGRLSGETGGTMVCLTVIDGQLRWASVGDSPLYLFRNNELRQLNEVHSMAAQLDLMVMSNQMDAETARTHPHRHCLTSAVTGREIPRVDCPETSQDLMAGDIVLLASDGINILSDDHIEQVLCDHQHRRSASIARELLDAVKRADDPDQDNTSIIAIKIDHAESEQAGALVRFGQRISDVAQHTRRRAIITRLRT